MVKKILASACIIVLLVAAFIYSEFKQLAKQPEFVIINNSKSTVSIEATWRNSKITIENIRSDGSFTFSMREEASMKLIIQRPKGEVEQTNIGYFTAGSSYIIEVGPSQTKIRQ